MNIQLDVWVAYHMMCRHQFHWRVMMTKAWQYVIFVTWVTITLQSIYCNPESWSKVLKLFWNIFRAFALSLGISFLREKQSVLYIFDKSIHGKSRFPNLVHGCQTPLTRTCVRRIWSIWNNQPFITIQIHMLKW